MNLFNRNKSPIPLLEEASARFPDEKRNTTLSDVLAFLFKRSAKHLKSHLERQHGVTLNHGQALNAVSSCLGFADWNTASATLQRVSDEHASEGTPVAPGSVATPAKLSTRPRMLADSLDFNTSSIIIGPAGCGKTCGLIFAAQRARALDKKRPVLVLRGFESPRYQPNWNTALMVEGKPATLETLDQAAPPQLDDKLEVWRPDMHPIMAHQELADWRSKALESMLAWLEKRKDMNPLVIVEEAHSVLEVYSTAFLRNVPKQATVIWSTQSIDAFYDLKLVAERFREIHLMKNSGYHSGFALKNQFHEYGMEKLLQKTQDLTVGQVVTLTLPSSPANRLRDLAE